MDTRDIVFSLIMVFSGFVLAYKLVYEYSPRDFVIVTSAVFLVGMVAALLLSINARLKSLEEELKEHERSLRVSMRSVEDEVQDKLGSAAKKLDEIKDELFRRGYR